MKSGNKFYAGYKLISSETEIENVRYTTYGISGKTVSVEDISVDKAHVLKMLKQINDAKLEECHLLEYIEDCLI